VLTLAICLFPVYPHSCKLLILYSCAGILFLILTLLLSKFFFSISLILDWSFPVSSFLYINILMECYKISLSQANSIICCGTAQCIQLQYLFIF
jgi:hypothetical protein